MKTLKDYILEAQKRGVALGHFNISNSEGFWAVVNAARRLNAPVVIGVSEGERDFLGVKQAKALVDSVSTEESPVFLNADHTYSVERVREVVDAGYDAVIIDCADKDLEENIKTSAEAVSYARSNNPEMLVEGELGFIGKSSAVLEVPPEGAAVSEETMTNIEDAARYVKETGVDLLAPAVGNIHGLVKTGNPKISIDRIKKLKSAVNVPLVLHGASGIPDEDIRAAIKAGISMIHVNTELRVAFKSGLQKGLQIHEGEVAPYKYLKESVEEMQAIVEEKLVLFSNL